MTQYCINAVEKIAPVYIIGMVFSTAMSIEVGELWGNHTSYKIVLP